MGETTLFCTNCGAKLPKDAKFCSSCGKAIVSIRGEEQVEIDRNQSTKPSQSTTPVTEQLPVKDENRPAKSGINQLNEEEEEELLRLFIGPTKEDYYMTKWKKKNSWNWAAFFLNVYWMAYRKMYGYTFGLFAFLIVLNIVTTLFDVELRIISGISIGYLVIFGLCGNRLYEEFARKKITKIRETQPNPENLPEMVSRQGGTSFKEVFAIMAVYVAITTASVFLIPNLSDLKDKPVLNTSEQVVEDNASNVDSYEEKIKSEITDVINENIDALRNEDVAAYMDTIYYDEASPDLYFQTEETSHHLFGNYDLAYTLDSIEFVSINPEEVTVRIQQTSVKVSGMEYTDNTATALNTFRKQDGKWKFYTTVVENIDYGNATSSGSSYYDDQVSYYDEAYAIYEQNCMDCHGNDLAGGPAPSLDTIGSKYTPANLQDIIQYGSGLMPGQSQLMDEELALLVEWFSGME